jgi:hypothetical protein
VIVYCRSYKHLSSRRVETGPEVSCFVVETGCDDIGILFGPTSGKLGARDGSCNLGGLHNKCREETVGCRTPVMGFSDCGQLL